MKTYYVLIHWDKNSAVTGFLVPNSKDEKHAISMLKKSLLVRKKLTSLKQDHGTLSIGRINDYLKSLKRPWRLNHRDKQNVFGIHETNRKVKLTVQVTELQLPTLADYWLTDICSGSHICNII